MTSSSLGSRSRGKRGQSARPVIERAGAADRAFLAMDRGQVPEQFGVTLELEGALDLDRVRDLVGRRVQAIPRLRQRLEQVPFGCGGPVWVDDPTYDIRQHVREVVCRLPGDEPALLDTALEMVTTPLLRDAPLWAVVLVTGLANDDCALVVVLHHVISDGVGGLAVLGSLVDPGPAPTHLAFPRPRPTNRTLARDAVRAKVRAVRGLRRSWQLFRTSYRAGGGLRPPRIADCSLMRTTGPRRAIAVVRADRPSLQRAAHAHGATTNDAVLVAVASALNRVLHGRGERVDELVVTVPVSGRAAEDGSGLGNLVSPIIVPVPVTGAVGDRLSRTAAEVRARKSAATGPAPIAVAGWLFRPLAALGGYHWYMNHQHRFHTLVSHLRGPAEPLTFGGREITGAVPVGVAEGGNATVYFEVLSYRGTLTISAIVDPDSFPDLDVLSDGLRAELDLVTHA